MTMLETTCRKSGDRDAPRSGAGDRNQFLDGLGCMATIRTTCSTSCIRKCGCASAAMAAAVPLTCLPDDVDERCAQLPYSTALGAVYGARPLTIRVDLDGD